MANEALMAKSRAESVEEEQTRTTGLKKGRKKHFALPIMRLGLRILMRGLVVSSDEMFTYILHQGSNGCLDLRLHRPVM